MSSQKLTSSADLVLVAALEAAGEKPPIVADDGGDNRDAKKNWAQRFSNALAMTVADQLRPAYKKARVTPHPDGTGQEASVGGKVDRKRTDVGVWDDAAGLVAGVSIKTLSFRDTHKGKDGQPRRVGRYVRNIKRNDMELRDEADTLHRRQPFSVLTALVFMPIDASWDGGSGQSSFAHAVFTLRKRTGRADPEGRFDLFEAVYIGLYDADGSVRFFDVREAPPKNQPPSRDRTLSLQDVVRAIDADVIFRNTGVRRNERYADPDPAWSPPASADLADLSDEPPLSLDDVIENAGRPDNDDEVDEG